MRASLLALCLLLPSVTACEQRSLKRDLTTASATGSGQALDGMQLESARRVAREQAKEGMKARNAHQLKQLRTWVEGRASVPVFPPEDLAALDAAIACLENGNSAEKLAEAKTSKLAEAARRTCEPSAAE